MDPHHEAALWWHGRYVAVVEPFKAPPSANTIPKKQIERAVLAYNQKLYIDIFANLEAHGISGSEMADLAGNTKYVAPQVECHDLDHPEASLLAGVKATRCEDCEAHRHTFSDFDTPWVVRTIERSRSLVRVLHYVTSLFVSPL